MKKLRKFLTVGVMVLSIIAMSGLTVNTAKAAAQAGDLIKMDGLSSVYYLGNDGKRYVFPSESVYFSWYNDFSGVVTIPASELQSYPLGANVTMRPGTKLVKITTDPSVYAVTPNGVLRKIQSEADAIALYGSNWNKMVVDVADAFFTNYTIGSALTSGMYPAGTLLKNANNASIYYYDGTDYRMISSEAAFNANRFNMNNVVTTSMTLTASGSAISGAEDLAKPYGATSGQVVTGSGLTVALSSMTPAAAAIPTGAVNVPYTKVNVTAATDGAITINSITFTRSGIGSANDFTNVYLYDGATRLTTGRSVNSSTNKVTFTGLNYTVPAGSTKTLTLTADINTSGNNDAFGIVSASDVMSTGATVSGSFPVTGNTMNIVSQSTGSVTIAKTGSLTNPKLGEQDAKVAEFNLTAGSVEDLSVEGLTLYQLGNISNANLTNFTLKQAGSTIATAASVNSNNNIVFTFNSAYNLDKGTTKTFEVYANIGSSARAGDTVKIYLDNASDLLARGKTYGYGVQVTRTAYDNGSNDGSDASWTSVDAGQITISYQGPSVTDYAVQDTDVELFRFTVTSQNNVEVRNTRLLLTAGGTDADADANDAGGLFNNTTANYTDVKFVDATTGQVLAGPKDVAYSVVADDASQVLTYTDTWNLTAGETKTIKVTADIANFTPAGNETIKATLNPFQSSDIKNLDNNLFVQTTDIVPSGAVAGAAHNVKTGSASVSLAGTPSVQTYINGAADVAMTGMNLTAGTGKDIKVTSIKLTATGAQSCDTESDCVLTVKLFDGSTQIGETKSLSGTTVTFNNLNLVVTKGTTKTLVAKATLNTLSTVLANTTLHFDVAAATDITAQDNDGNSVTLAGTVTGPTHSILGSGTIAATLAPDEINLTESRIVLAGNTDETLAKYKFTATNEDLKLTKMRVQLSANTSEEVASLALYDGSTKLTGDVVPTNGATIYADFNSFTQDFIVPKDSSKTLTVKANLNTVSAGAASGTTIAASLVFDTNFEVRGVNSNTVITSVGAANVDGRSMTVRKTKATLVENAIANTNIVNGSEQEIYNFSVSADSKEDVAMKQLKFAVSLTDNVGTTDNTLAATGLKLYRNGSDITSLVGAMANLSEASTGITVAFTGEEVIAKGSTNVYSLRATLTGYTTGADDDSITVKLNSDSSADLVSGTAGTQNTVAFATIDQNDNFVWSDNSATSHSLTSLDWTNGYQVKNLPFSGKTMNN
ncbi:MAG: hypothetical protein PHG95_02490 [Patescibacteria group bacterium]|nr:hypothetical protein [Patescibacteria group bacterium]